MVLIWNCSISPQQISYGQIWKHLQIICTLHCTNLTNKPLPIGSWLCNRFIEVVNKEQQLPYIKSKGLSSKFLLFVKLCIEIDDRECFTSVAQCISFNRKAPDSNLGGLKNQEKISQFSAAPDQLPNMRCQFHSKKLLKMVFNPSSYWDCKKCLYEIIYGGLAGKLSENLC